MIQTIMKNGRNFGVKIVIIASRARPLVRRWYISGYLGRGGEKLTYTDSIPTQFTIQNITKPLEPNLRPKST
jgi:hypothetical protein